MIIINDATSWSITPGSSIMLLESSISGPLCSERTFIAQASLMMIVIYDHHIFIEQATGVIGSGQTRTLYLWMMRQVFFHCSKAAGTSFHRLPCFFFKT